MVGVVSRWIDRVPVERQEDEEPGRLPTATGRPGRRGTESVMCHPGHRLDAA